jgi:hypothetical protein
MKLLAVTLAGGLLMGAGLVENPSPQQADAFQQKLTRIVQQGESKSGEVRQTILTEGEVNSYLRFRAGPLLPVGVTDPSIGILGQGRLNGRAIVDLDVIREKKGSGGWFDPTSYLTGRLPVTASGVLHTREGKGRFALATAEVSGIPIPKAFLQEIVSFYTRTDDNPQGINIDDVFTLPAEIRSIGVDKGRAIVVQ